MAVTAAAYACQRYTTLRTSPRSGPPGGTVTGSGANYSTAATASDVLVRFKTRTGQVLWQGRPNDSGKINFSFRIPNARPGDYVILATQSTATGAPAAGTPGRAALRITRAGRSAVVVPPAKSGPSADEPTLVVEPQRAPGLVDGSVLLALLALAGIGSIAGLGWRKARSFAGSSL